MEHGRNPVGRGRFRCLVLALLLVTACAPPQQEPGAAIPFQPHETAVTAPSEISQAISDKSFAVDSNVPTSQLNQLVAGNTAFALDLYQATRGTEGNLFFSPFSISQALAMAFAGARGQTEAQMADTLHFTLDQGSFHAAFNSLSQSLAQSARTVAPTSAEADAGEQAAALELTIANGLWAQQGYPFLPTFLDPLAEHYGAGVYMVDFQGQAELSRQVINNWVAAQTAQRIQDLLPPGSIHALTRMVLTNAIYFKATWAKVFDPLATQDGPFFRLDGSQVTVPLMFRVGSLDYGSGDGYQVVELPYHGHTASMVVILPEQGRFEEVEEDLTADRLKEMLAQLARQDVALTLPKFTLEPTSISLGKTLAVMGMPTAFGSGADFSGMDGTRELFIDDVIHKAFVAVDEQGTEAAAATAMTLAGARQLEPVEVRVDRPFIFLIRDMETGTVLFLGRVLDPVG